MDTQPAINKPAELKAHLLAVARLRQSIDDFTQEMEDILALAKESQDYKFAETSRAALSAKLVEAETQAKAYALEVYAETGKKSQPGVTIKTFTSKEIRYDLATARGWAQEHAPELIVLDTKRFEAHVLAVAKTVPVPCAEIVETKTDKAQIATDLSELKGN